MSAKVIIEKPIAAHPPELYRASGAAESITGFSSLDDSARESYEENGFLLVRNALAPELTVRATRELQAMRAADDPDCEAIYYEGTLRERLAPGDHETRTVSDLPRAVRQDLVRKFMGFVGRHEPLTAVACHPPLLEAVRKLGQAPMRLFQDMAMVKPPGGREKPWHQDHAYFNLPLDTHVVAAWIALGEATVENGCMHVLPGGHRDGPRPHFARRDWQLCDADLLGKSCLALPMATGDVLLFDGKLPHGTPTNRTADWRWALQFHYVPEAVGEVDETVRLEAFGSEGKEVTC